MTARTCQGAFNCLRQDTRRYLTGYCCPEHTPARWAGHEEPGRTACPGQFVSRYGTPTFLKGATDINKDRPGGYMSRQRAQKLAAARDRERSAIEEMNDQSK